MGKYLKLLALPVPGLQAAVLPGGKTFLDKVQGSGGPSSSTSAIPDARRARPDTPGKGRRQGALPDSTLKEAGCPAAGEPPVCYKHHFLLGWWFTGWP